MHLSTNAICGSLFFFFNDTATTEIYTLSLHDALPSCCRCPTATRWRWATAAPRPSGTRPASGDRKSTRLNSSHVEISYAVFCLKKKKKEASLFFFGKKKKKIQ